MNMNDCYGSIDQLLDQLDSKIFEIDSYIASIEKRIAGGNRVILLPCNDSENLSKYLWKISMKADFMKSRLKSIHKALGLEIPKLDLNKWLDGKQFNSREQLASKDVMDDDEEKAWKGIEKRNQ